MNTKLTYLFVLFFIISLLSGCNGTMKPEDLGIAPSTVTEVPTDGSNSTTGLFIVSGNNQSIQTGSATGQSLKVQVLENGKPLANKTIIFSQKTVYGGAFSNSAPLTDGDGYAETFYTAGLTSADGLIIARYLEKEVEFGISIIPQATKTISIVSGNSQSGTVGQDLLMPFKVRVIDSTLQQPVPNIAIKFQALTSGGNFLGNLTQTVLTDSSGEATATYTQGFVTGANSVKAFIQSSPSDEVTFLSSASAGNPSIAHTEISAPAGSLIADGASYKTITLTLKDSFGNIVSGGTGKTIVFSTTQGSMIGSVSDNGDGTYSQNLKAPSTKSGAVAAISATIDGVAVTAIKTVPIDENTLPSGLYLLAGNNQTISATATTGQTLKVQLLVNGQPAANKTINFTQKTITGGTFENPSPVTDGDGIAETNYTAGATGGTGTISARYLTDEVVFGITVTNLTSKTIALVSGNNQSGVVGQDLAYPYKVRVVDSVSGNPTANIAVRFQALTAGGNFAGNLSQTINTNAFGEATATYTLGYGVGANSVKAYILNTPTEEVIFNSTASVGSVSAAQSIISAPAGGLTADGTSYKTITLTVKDSFGNTITNGAGHTVVFSTSQGTMLGTVADNGDGTYTQNLRAPLTRSGANALVSATVNGGTVNSTKLIPIIAGNVDLAQSAVTSEQSSIVANGSASTIIKVILKDQNGNQVSSGGETVVISTSTGTLLGSVVDQADGSYTQVLRSSTSVTSATVSATVSGVAVGTSASVAFVPGPVDVTKSILTATPVNIPPDGLSSSLVILQLKDAYGNNLKSGVGDTISFLADRGTWLGSLYNHGDGTYSRFLQAGTQSGVAAISASYSGSSIVDGAIVYFSTAASGPSLFNSTVEIIGNDLLAADGTTTATIKVTLKDSNNTKMPAGGSNVLLTATAGNLLGSIQDNGDGTYSQLIRTSITPTVNAIVTATVDGLNITDTASLTFYGAINLANSTLTSFPSAIEANGASTSLIVLKAYDVNNTPIPVGGVSGLTVARTAGTGALAGTNLTDNGNGTYSQVITAPSSIGTATLTSYLNGVAFNDNTSVEYFQAQTLPSTIDCANIASFKNKALVVDNVTLQMNTHGTTSCASEFVFTNIILRNNAVLTHTVAAATSNAYGIELTADQIFIDSTSQINVSAKGYSSSSYGILRVPSASGGQNLSGTHYVGGCHGGIGGRNQGSSSCLSYGNPFLPFELGSSGAYTDGNWRATTGGGRVKLKVLGILSNDGSIKADGQDSASSPNNYLMGGSGGSVLIDAKTITGTGTITANGANTNGSTPTCSGGGGGRIALYYEQIGGVFASTASMFSKLQAFGGLCSASATANNGGAGTIFLKSSSESYGDMIINNNSVVTGSSYSTTPLNVPAVSYATNLSSTALTKIGGFVPNYTGRFPYEGFYLDPNTIQNASSTKTDNQFFKITGGTDNSISLTGGDPTLVNTNILTQPYQLMMVLNSLEIRGKAQLSGDAPVVVTKGDISSSDTTTLNIQGFPPKGLDPFAMNNIVIDLVDQPQTLSDFTLKTWKGLTLKNGSANFATSYLMSALTLDKMAITASVQRKNYLFDISGNFLMQNISSLTQAATGDLITPGQEYSIELRAGNVSISADSFINASNKGYNARNAYKCQTVGNREIANTTNFAGSHGGNGGSGNSYGNFMDPYYSGESCYCKDYGVDGNNQRGAGGGVVRIDAGTGNLNINGTISVDGETTGSGHYCSNAGAGGSIYLKGGALTGAATLSARGGGATSAGGNGNGGGGGRIAIYGSTFSGNFTGIANMTGFIKAWGGKGNTRHGSAGTIFIKDREEAYGDLLLHNDNNTQSFTTSLKLPSANSSSVDQTSLVMDTSYKELSLDTGYLTGLYLNPKTNQNTTATTSDDTLFLVTNHSDTTLTTAANLRSTGAVDGSPFSLVAILKRLEITNGAHLTISGGGHLRVETGDLKSAPGVLSVPKLGIQGTGYLDLSALNSASFDQVTWATTFLPIFGNSVSFTTSSLEVNTPLKYSGDLTLSGTTLTSKIQRKNYLIDISGNLTVQNTSTIIQGPTSELSTPGQEYSIELRAGNFTQSSDSIIRADAKGYYAKNYLKCQTIGNREIPNTTPYAGSHGGNGGSGNTFGNFMDPYFSGESCFCNSSTDSNNARGAGGGIVRIDVGSGTLTLNGSINVNGETVGSGHYCSNGGAGGSIYLNAGTLNGSGTLTSVGGGASSAGGNGNGGGGGRIAMFASTFGGNFTGLSNQIGFVKAWGGQGNTRHGSAGTIYIKDKEDTYGDMLLNNNSNTQSFSTFLKVPTGSNTSLNQTTLVMDNVQPELTIDTGFLKGLYLNPKTNQNATTTSRDDSVFLITNHTQGTLTTDGNLQATGATAGSPYSIIAILKRLEITNNAQLSLVGGGHLRVETGDLKSSPGQMTVPKLGTIGTGVLDLSGLTTSTLDQMVWGSSLNTLFSNNVTLSSSTIELTSPLKFNGNLTLSGSTITSKVLRGNLLLDVSGNLVLQNTSSIVQGPTSELASPGQEYSIEIKAANFSQSSDSSIRADGKGYYAKNYLKCQTVGNREIPNPTPYAGSHGGNGGSGNTYGNFMDPYYSGESCFCNSTSDSNNSRGAGGGIVRIDVGSGNLTVNGPINVNGDYGGGGYYCSNGGSGGSIYLSAGTLTGAGTLSSIGGAASSGGGNGNGGGGGRIALYASTFSGNFTGVTNQISFLNAWGGRGNTRHGSAGTIYIKDTDDQHGDLLVNNNGNTKNFTTPIRVPSGTVTSRGSGFVEMNAVQTEVGLETAFTKGLYVNPNTNQNSTPTSTDDQIFKVVDQSGVDLDFNGVPDSVSQAGDPFALIAILNRLEVRGLASVELVGGGHLRVNNGDFAGAATNSLSIPLSGITGTGKIDTTNVVNTSYNNIAPSSGLHFIMANNTYFNNSNFSSYNLLRSEGNVYLDGTNLTMYRQIKNLSLKVAGNLILQNISSLIQAPTSDLINSGEEYTLEIEAGNFSLSNDSSITAMGKGYSARNYLKCTTVGNREVANPSWYSASHGGNGGSGNTYGSFANPYFSGESCFCGYTGDGNNSRGAGGGVVRINTGIGNIVVNGTINVNGASGTGSYYCGTGGAGGSIYLNGGSVSGSGTLSSIGGVGTSSVIGAGGGGGRIAIHATSVGGSFSGISNQISKLNAWGGTGGSKHASAGTIYIRNKNNLYGDLIINNNSNTKHYTTPIRTPAGGFIEQITNSTANLTHNHREFTWDTRLIEGLYINPNTAQGNRFEVLSHIVDDIITTSGLVSVGAGAVNASYSLSAIFNNIYIYNNGALDTVGTGVLETVNPVTYSGATGPITGQATLVIPP